jgi:hypothetical protein
MIRKMCCTTVVLLAGLVLWPLAANPAPRHIEQSRPEKADPKPKAVRTIVNLKCEWVDISSGVGNRFRAVVTNNTGSTIPVSTTIYWSVTDSVKGVIFLQQALPVGSKKASDPRFPIAGTVDPKAWYYK